MNGLIGLKLGMTRIFNDNGVSIPVTIIEVQPNRITYIKNIKKDGYCAVQVTISNNINVNRINKPKLGQFIKSKLKVGHGLWEIRISEYEKFKIGDIVTAGIFKDVKKVDITGISKGKGFSGVIKRWNFSMQDASHGNSLSHRAPGSIGQNQTPGRVFKGKKMAGQLGNCRITVQNLDIVTVDLKENLLVIKGAVPGMIGSNIIIKKSVKC